MHSFLCSLEIAKTTLDPGISGTCEELLRELNDLMNKLDDKQTHMQNIWMLFLGLLQQRKPEKHLQLQRCQLFYYQPS